MTHKRDIITHATEAAWLADRKKYTTSTEAAALFGQGAYVKTEYELYCLKAGLVTNDFEGNERTRWGTRLESVIAYGVAEDYGLVVQPFKNFIVMPEFFLAASFDFIVTGIVDGFPEENEFREMFRKHGRGLVEIKNVDSLAFKRGWEVSGEHVEAPVQIEFQVQAQMEVADLPWCIITPLVGGNTPMPVLRVRDTAVGEAIRAKSLSLWQRINAGAPPAPDFTKDADTVSKVYRDNDGSSIDLSDNARLSILCKQYKKAAADAKAAEEIKNAAKAEILTIVQAAKSVQYTGGKISAGTNKESYRAYYRDGYTKCTITVSEIEGTDIEATVPAYRNVRITEAA